MTSVPFVKFYPSDWTAGCANLSPTEEIIYFKICLHNWDCGEPMPERVLTRAMRGQCEGNAVALDELVLMGKIQKCEDGFSNVRAIDLHNEAQDRRKSSTNAANKRWKTKKKSADAPALKPHCDGIAVALKGQCQPEPEPELELEDISFDQFWNLVPLKKGKGQARKALKTALKKTDMQTILVAMTAYAETRIGQDPSYTAHPATWLNGERWTDETAADQEAAQDANIEKLFDDIKKRERAI